MVIILSEKQYKVPDIKPTFLKINLHFTDGDWNPASIAIQVEDDEGKKNAETDKKGNAKITVKGDKTNVLLFGDTNE